MACARSSSVTAKDRVLPLHDGMPFSLRLTSTGGSSVSREVRASLDMGAFEGPPSRFEVWTWGAVKLISAAWCGLWTLWISSKGGGNIRGEPRSAVIGSFPDGTWMISPLPHAMGLSAGENGVARARKYRRRARSKVRPTPARKKGKRGLMSSMSIPGGERGRQLRPTRHVQSEFRFPNHSRAMDGGM